MQSVSQGQVCCDNFTLKQKLHTKIAIPSSHSTLTPGQSVLELTLEHQRPSRIATRTLVLGMSRPRKAQFDDNNTNTNNHIERRNSRFLTMSSCTSNCLQHIRSSGQGAIMHKSCATHQVLITCNMSCGT